MKTRFLLPAVLVFVYSCATLQAVRYYSKTTDFYLNMSAYLDGHERLPFQERILPALILRPMFHSQWMSRYFHSNGAFTAARGPFYLLSLVSLIIAAIYTQKLYEQLSPRGTLRALVYPIFLFAVVWTYSIHVEADYSYPYDLPSLAFFTAGLYYIYRRRFLPLFLVVLIGSFNRETTLFLIGIYLLDALSTGLGDQPADSGALHFHLRSVPWARLALLSAVWVAIKAFLFHHFRGNDTSEDILRIHYNLNELRIRLIPALLNVCGYTLPIVLLFRRWLRPLRFRNYLWILPLWLVVMFCSGVLVETRIFGELCSFSAISLVLILETYMESAIQTNQTSSALDRVVDLDPEAMMAAAEPS